MFKMKDQEQRASVLGQSTSILRNLRETMLSMPELAKEARDTAKAQLKAIEYGVTRVGADTDAEVSDVGMSLGNKTAARKRLAEKSSIINDLKNASKQVDEMPVGDKITKSNEWLEQMSGYLKTIAAKAVNATAG
jgi:hypothetical protein